MNATAFAPGDQIFFQGGATFSGGLTFGAGSGGTASNPIRIDSYGTGRATIAAPAAKDGFFAYNAAGFSISNLNFQGPGATQTGKQGVSFYNDLAGSVKLAHVHIDSVTVSGFKNGILIGGWNAGSGFDDVRITNVIAHDNLEAGISMYGYPLSSPTPNHAHTNVYVAFSQAYNNFGDPNSGRPSGNGIVLGGVNGGVIERCIAHDNGKNNLTNAGPVGIWAYDATRITIQHNESYRNQTSGTGDGDGFDLDINVTNSVLQYNYAHDNDGAGFLVYADSSHPNANNVVRYNISENDGKKLAGYGGIVVGGSVSNVDVYGNTVYVSSAASDPAALRVTTWGGTPQNLRVWNNIFYSHKGTTGSVKLIDSPVNSTYAFRGNNYFDDSGAFAIRWGTATYANLSGWLNVATTQERQNGVIVGKTLNPVLVMPGGGGTVGNAQALEASLSAYRLQSNSPMVDAGLDVSALFGVNPGARDFYGDTIPINGSFDIGADELGTPGTPQPPATPQGLSAIATAASSITVSWQDVAGETGYLLERAGPDGNFAQIATPLMDSTIHVDTAGVSASTTYSYRLAAVNAAGSSPYSAVASITTPDPPPLPPSVPANLRVTGVTRSSISLSWSDVSNESGYKIERSTNGNSWTQIAVLGPDATGFTNSRLKANTTYLFRLRAYNAGGNSGYAGPVNARTSR